tara:strand:+ start:267 stop:458 length:192 start_codon:yes stop_codon:yes gene_type:complete
MIRIDISLDDLDVVYRALENDKPQPVDLLGQPVLNIADAATLHEINEVLFRLRDQDDRYVRAQ